MFKKIFKRDTDLVIEGCELKSKQYEELWCITYTYIGPIN